MDMNASLDEWQPSISEKTNSIPMSKWRKEQNQGSLDVKPGFSDLKKILAYIKRGAPEYEIMQSFGISASTMQAIKDDRYCPVSGIKHDTLCKIQREFSRLDNKIWTLTYALSELVNLVFVDKSMEKDFLSKTGFRKHLVPKRTKAKKRNVVEHLCPMDEDLEHDVEARAMSD